MKNEIRIAVPIGLAAALCVGLASAALAGGGNDAPDVIKPYYYQPPGGPLNAVDQQQLMVYRDQLELQRQSLQLEQDRGTSGPSFPPMLFQPPVNPTTTSSQLFRTQSELDRVNGLLDPVRSNGSLVPSPMTGSPPLPILPMGMGTQFVITTH